MKIIMLNANNYEDKNRNYGDCIIIDTGTKIVIYDCGSEEHAKAVMKYMEENRYDKAYFILSHNDADHFNGLPILIENNKIQSITTTLLFKHIEEILNELDDDRRNKNSVINQIKSRFDNIASLTGNNLNDSLDESLLLDPCINIVGPNKNYVTTAVAKALDNSESDCIDAETIINAISVQVEIIISNKKLLLTGDCSFDAIADKVREYDAIQLPHHGKNDQGQKIFELNSGRENVLYLISDNTGNSNGGSDELMNNSIGKKVKNTKSGKIIIDEYSFKTSMATGCYYS